MKCHYTYYADKKGKVKKVLIPECWSVVHSNDISDCSCGDFTFQSFEKKRYNETLAMMQK